MGIFKAWWIRFGWFPISHCSTSCLRHVVVAGLVLMDKFSLDLVVFI